MISISDPSDRPARLAPGFAALLRTAFWDVARPVPGLRYGKPCLYRPITEKRARELVEFIERWHLAPGGPEKLVIDCEAGISRSAAVAKRATERHGIRLAQDTEFANAEVLRKLRRGAGMTPIGTEEGELR